MFNKNDYFLVENRNKVTEDLSIKGERLPNPTSYFHGLSSSASIIVPDNILLFFRQKIIGKNAPALHHRFVLICNLGGRGSAIIDSKVFPLQVGEALLVFPHQFHLYADFETEKISWLFITFEVEFQGILSNKQNAVVRLSDYAMISLSLLVEAYLFSIQKNQQVALPVQVLLTSILSEMTSHLLNNPDSKEPLENKTLSHSLQLIQHIVEYVYQNLNAPLQIKNIAKQVHLSPSHLRSRFKEIMRIGLGAYIRQARIHRACFLIRSDLYSFSQVSNKCGFSSLYSFSRAFRLVLKMSPTQYKKTYPKQ